MKPQSKTFFIWFLTFYALWGFYSLPDQGVPLDELTQRYIGIQNNKFITGTATSDAIEKEGPFGPVFESVSYAFEQVIYQQPMRVKIMMRHGLLFSLFLLALWCFYNIAKRIFQTPNTAGITSMMLALYPPLFVHTNINSKDTFFLILLIFSFYFLLRFFETKHLKFLVLMCIITGMASTVRITGWIVFFVFITGLWMRKEFQLKSLIYFSSLTIIITLVSFYAFFPYLWLHPIEGIQRIFVYTTNNPWPSPTLCANQWIFPGHAPWWYLPAWLGVTIPVLAICLFFAGIYRYIKNPIFRKSAIINSILLLFFLPLFSVLILRPTLYDGWRHFQFLIIPFFLIAGMGMEPLLKSAQSKIWSLAISGYTFISFFLWTPFGYAYMNEFYALLFPPNSFTQDYWGLSAKPALEWIVAHDTSSVITINSFTEAPELNSQILPPEINSRFRFLHNDTTAKYEIQSRRQKYFGTNTGKEVFSICPMKDTIIRVIQLR